MKSVELFCVVLLSFVSVDLVASHCILNTMTVNIDGKACNIPSSPILPFSPQFRIKTCPHFYIECSGEHQFVICRDENFSQHPMCSNPIQTKCTYAAGPSIVEAMCKHGTEVEAIDEIQ